MVQPKYLSYGSYDSNSLQNPPAPPQVKPAPAPRPAPRPPPQPAPSVPAPQPIPSVPAAQPIPSVPAPQPPVQAAPVVPAEWNSNVALPPQEFITTGQLPLVPMWMRPTDNAPVLPPAPAVVPVSSTSESTLPPAPLPTSEVSPVPLPVPVSPPATEVQPVLVPQPDPIPSQSLVQQLDGASFVSSKNSSAAARDPKDVGDVNAAWPDTPQVVPAADNLPALPPATFGQFAVPPAG